MRLHDWARMATEKGAKQKNAAQPLLFLCIYKKAKYRRKMHIVLS